MNHAFVTRHAHRVLVDPESSLREKEVAAGTLVAAADQGIAPAGSSSALWSYLRTNPRGSHASEAMDAIGNHLPIDTDVLSGATDVVRDPRSDRRLYEAAVTILSGTSYAGSVTPDTLLAISECSVQMGRRVIFTVARVVEAVHDASGIPVEVLRALRDNWSRSLNEDVRSVAPDIARLLPVMDVDWLTMMLRDRSAQVRRSVAAEIARMAEPEKALVIIEQRISEETHHEILGALHDAVAEIVREVERRDLRRR